MVALTLLSRILTLVLALIVVAVQKILVAILVGLSLKVVILTLIVPEIWLGRIIILAPWIESTVSPGVSSMNGALFLGVEIFLLCLRLGAPP